MKALSGWVIALGLLYPGTAWANPLKSLYTTIELAACVAQQTEPRGEAWLCPGLKDYPVYILQHDRHTFVSAGQAPEKRLAARQSLVAENSLFRGNSGRTTLEWRIVRRNGQAIPFATIQRIFTRDGSRSGEVLVVTKVTPVEDCHAAYVDALANPDAIALARAFADREARSHACKSGPRKIGQIGRSPM